jgi:hypothetical protein
MMIYRGRSRSRKKKSMLITYGREERGKVAEFVHA